VQRRDHGRHERHPGGLRRERRKEDLDRPAAVEPLDRGCPRGETGLQRLLDGPRALDGLAPTSRPSSSSSVVPRISQAAALAAM
jgi:hypothetical protein